MCALCPACPQLHGRETQRALLIRDITELKREAAKYNTPSTFARCDGRHRGLSTSLAAYTRWPLHHFLTITCAWRHVTLCPKLCPLSLCHYHMALHHSLLHRCCCTPLLFGVASLTFGTTAFILRRALTGCALSFTQHPYVCRCFCRSAKCQRQVNAKEKQLAQLETSAGSSAGDQWTASVQQATRVVKVCDQHEILFPSAPPAHH